MTPKKERSVEINWAKKIVCGSLASIRAARFILKKYDKAFSFSSDYLLACEKDLENVLEYWDVEMWPEK